MNARVYIVIVILTQITPHKFDLYTHIHVRICMRHCYLYSLMFRIAVSYHTIPTALEYSLAPYCSYVYNNLYRNLGSQNITLF